MVLLFSGEGEAKNKLRIYPERNMKASPNMRSVVAILISLCAFITAPDGYRRQEVKAASQSQSVLNDQDQAEIIKSVVEHAIANPVTTFNISWTETVSSENMTESMLPKISGYRFSLVDPDKIIESANRSGYTQYLVFSRMRAWDGKVSVGVCRVTNSYLLWLVFFHRLL